MKNFVQSGETLTLTAPTGGVVSGSTYKIGLILIVAGVTVAQGQPFAGKTHGVFDMPAATGQAWTEGQLLYWDDTAKVYTSTASSNQKAGVATAAKLSATATGRVKLISTI